MLGLNRKTDYALVALATLADERADDTHPLSARVIAKRHQLPPNLLMQVLKELHQAGLVESVRGTGGGYYLAQPAERITILSVVKAIDGQVRMAVCCGEEEVGPNRPCLACVVSKGCPITTGIRKLNDRIVSFMGQVTIQDLLRSEMDVMIAPRIAPSITRATSEVAVVSR